MEASCCGGEIWFVNLPERLMFRTILVPLDGSSFAEAAVPVAARLARSSTASLHLVLAHQPTAALVGVGFGEIVAPSIDLDEDLKTQERGYLAAMAANLAEAGAGVTEYSDLVGPAGPAICEEAARIDADLVIMATHGRSAAGRLWHGSVADHVVRHVSAPVLLIHSEREGTRMAERAIPGILVALDLSSEAEAILAPVEVLARLLQAPVTLMHVIVGPLYQVGKRAAIEGRLEKIAAAMRRREVQVSILVTTGVNAPWTLRNTLEQPRFGLLAMTTHGTGGLRRLWTGSVAAKVAEAAVKPMLLLRPHRED
jgi:nucleotide-binding universal stress UspA family protein